MKEFSYSCPGESHIIDNKVCQDASFSSSDETISIAIVCDGHGGSRYFRSDIGSQLAVEVACNSVMGFIAKVDQFIFKGKPFAQRGTLLSEKNSKTFLKDSDADKALRQLFASIIYSWGEKIKEHSKNTPLSEKERETAGASVCAEFEKGIGLENTYGCTLMCYVYTDKFWFAFHIGDGKCIAFEEDGTWLEPIPWDEKCFLNKTTSLCDSSALDEFRYCYCGGGHHPLAVFLGSDGIDDSFGETENMVNFYVQVLKLISREGEESAIVNIHETLPKLSRAGSQDDMSIACVYDEAVLSAAIPNLIEWQRNNVERQLQSVNQRIQKIKKDIRELGKSKEVINYQLASKSLPKELEQKQSLVTRWNKFAEELEGDSFTPYKDEITDEDNKVQSEPADSIKGSSTQEGRLSEPTEDRH